MCYFHLQGGNEATQKKQTVRSTETLRGIHGTTPRHTVGGNDIQNKAINMFKSKPISKRSFVKTNFTMHPGVSCSKLHFVWQMKKNLRAPGNNKTISKCNKVVYIISRVNNEIYVTSSHIIQKSQVRDFDSQLGHWHSSWT